jgi:1,4-dihydroxy-6-naphthoate synthase
MGEEWEKRTGLPIPLGAIVARRALGERRIEEVTEAIRASVHFAWNVPDASRDYVSGRWRHRSSANTSICT